MTNPDRDELVKLADEVAVLNVFEPALRESIVSRLRRLASSERGVKVRELEWQRIGDCWKADRYSIRIDQGVPVYYIVSGWSSGTNPCDTLEAAKAAAQRDYEARIKSALVEVPAVKGEPEPVAWPANLNPRTLDLVQRFALALAKKLRLAEEKYGHTDGWSRDDWEAECRDHLYQHLEKGDPRDVAAYCAFMWHHGWITYRPVITAQPADAGMREALEPRP